MVVVRCFPTHCLHFTGQALWAVIWACLECWSDIKVLEAWAVEPLKRWLLHCVSCTRKAQTVREGFSFIWPSPLDKTGGRYNPKHLSAVDLQTPHSEAKGLLPPPPQTWQNQSTEPHSWVLPNAATLTGWWVVKVCFKGLDYTTSTTMRTNALMARS